MIINSTCMGDKHRDTPSNLEKMYEKLGYDAERAGNYTAAQYYFNHAEFMKKLQRGER